MSTTTFDTLAASKELQNAGMDAAQAEAIAKVVKDGQGELATKADIEQLRNELKSDIKTMQWIFSLFIGINFVVMLAGFTLLATLIK